MYCLHNTFLVYTTIKFTNYFLNENPLTVKQPITNKPTFKNCTHINKPFICQASSSGYPII